MALWFSESGKPIETRFTADRRCLALPGSIWRITRLRLYIANPWRHSDSRSLVRVPNRLAVHRNTKNNQNE